jgi:hypothetical protein
MQKKTPKEWDAMNADEKLYYLYVCVQEADARITGEVGRVVKTLNSRIDAIEKSGKKKTKR